eukprot:TRINITY_DN65998_c0_g1_i1.p1 TRINITY_DN65998_c0_g1~~TRINITY_DN65998_c0_g1_i1.p1  ORF type:complete len:541 (-),score=215.62 TRINITY_DN65998_c0_g1_i1:24-1415(-)
MTEGVDMVELQMPCAGDGAGRNDRLTQAWWDFAGQQVFYAAHSLSLSVNCVYVVVWDPRRGLIDDTVRLWLNEIQARVTDGDYSSTPVFMVATHKDGDEDQTDPASQFALLREEFPKLLRKERFFHVSNAESFNVAHNYESIVALRSALVDTALSMSGVRVLHSSTGTLRRVDHSVRESWSTLAADVVGRKSAVDVQLVDDTRLLIEGMRQVDIPLSAFDAVAQQLHDWGVLLYFKEGLRTAVCFDALWLVRAAQRVLPEAGAKVIHRSVLSKAWSGLPPGTQSNLRFVMRVCGLMFAVGDFHYLVLPPRHATFSPAGDDGDDVSQRQVGVFVNKWVFKTAADALPRNLFGLATAALATVPNCTLQRWQPGRGVVRVGDTDALLTLSDRDDAAGALLELSTNKLRVLADLSDALEIHLFRWNPSIAELVEEWLVSYPKCSLSARCSCDPPCLWSFIPHSPLSA